LKKKLLALVKNLEKSEKYALFGIIGIIILLIIGIVLGLWNLNNDILAQIPSNILLPAIVGLLLFGFRNRILSLPIQTLFKKNIQNSQVQKEIGNPNSFDKGIQHYNSRDRIPFSKIIDEAKKTVDLSGLTFNLIRLNDLDLIEQKLQNGVEFIFIFPDINSKIIDSHIGAYKSSKNLKKQIEDSLREFCELKTNYNNLIIKTNIILIDKDNPKTSFIKVESRIKGKSPNTRPSDLAFLNDNKEFYSDWRTVYDNLLKKSSDYVC
jgi:hypothetical protein